MVLHWTDQIEHSERLRSHLSQELVDSELLFVDYRELQYQYMDPAQIWKTKLFHAISLV